MYASGLGSGNGLSPLWHQAITHYYDVIMNAISFQITSPTIVYSTVYSGTDQRKHQSSASLAFVRGIHRSPVNSPRKWPVTRKMPPFDDVIMPKLKLAKDEQLQLKLGSICNCSIWVKCTWRYRCSPQTWAMLSSRSWIQNIFHNCSTTRMRGPHVSISSLWRIKIILTYIS